MNQAGARAEELCAELLRRAGLRILARNWRCRHGEIDLVAEENGALAWAMDRGDGLHARVSRLSEHPNPRRRIEFEVYVE